MKAVEFGLHFDCFIIWCYGKQLFRYWLF